MNTSIPQIEAFLTARSARIKAAGFSLAQQKELPYGIQLRYVKGGNEYLFKVYYSKKKGISIVSHEKETPDYYELNQIFRGVTHGAPGAENPFGTSLQQPTITPQKWIGTDEAGKGDYFGPLVACAFFVEASDVPRLREIGAADCKTMTDKKVIAVAEKILTLYPDNYEIAILPPREYNNMMVKCIRNGKNLNHMLAYLHTSAIKNLSLQVEAPDLILIDQFSKRDLITPMMQVYQGVPILQRPRAESDPAVAVASVLARYVFLSSLERMSVEYNAKFPKGATNVIAFGADLCLRETPSVLYETAKLHFKTTDKIRVMVEKEQLRHETSTK